MLNLQEYKYKWEKRPWTKIHILKPWIQPAFIFHLKKRNLWIIRIDWESTHFQKHKMIQRQTIKCILLQAQIDVDMRAVPLCISFELPELFTYINSIPILSPISLNFRIRFQEKKTFSSIIVPSDDLWY